MWELQLKLHSMISGMLARRRHGRGNSPSRCVDWLPPVLGPYDWSTGIMADRSANWYFDRDRA
jgi:hypothetical protein